MKKSIINDYLKTLKTLVNDERITFAITGNFADECNIVAYFDKLVLSEITLFNDSDLFNTDCIVSDYLAIMSKHPTRSKQLFKLNYDTKGYCYLAVTDSSNLEFIGVRSKRINKKLATNLYDYVIDDEYGVDLLSCHTDKYITTYNFNQTVLFRL